MDFEFNSIPFSFLDEKQKQYLLSKLDISYFKKGEYLQRKEEEQKYIYILIKGIIVASSLPHYTQDLITREFIKKDCVGNSSILSGESSVYLIAKEETLCHRLDSKTFLRLVAENENFARFFQGRLKERNQLRNLENTPSELTNFMLTHIRDVPLDQPFICQETSSIEQTVLEMRERKVDCALVKSGHRFGIVTRTDLLEALILHQKEKSYPVSKIANFPVLTNSSNDFLFQTLINMVSNHIARVVVEEEGRPIGILELSEILAQLSHKSHLLALRITKCNSIQSLIGLASEIDEEVYSLAKQDASPKLIAELASALNGQLMRKAMGLIIPAEHEKHYCFVTLGSEGRAEQILKTDQDNALILSDDHPFSDQQVADYCETLIQTLLQCGYPACEGKVMINNPYWRGTSSEWENKLKELFRDLDGENLMNLAILLDAHCTAGNPELFSTFAKRIHQIPKSIAFFTYFAKPILNFATPLGLLGGIKTEKGILDIKKSGIFPIVHGVRTLAIEANLNQTNTFQRIEALEKEKIIKTKMASDISLSLELFLRLRLRAQILQQNQEIRLQSRNQLDINQCSRLERSMLHDALETVDEFKSHLIVQYHIQD